MKFSVRVLSRAQRDVDRILTWMSETMKSPEGAIRWLRAFDISLDMLAEDPRRFPLAEENRWVTRPIQQLLFKTSKGGKYRMIFTIEGSDVLILRVRGPGQPPLTQGELSL